MLLKFVISHCFLFCFCFCFACYYTMYNFLGLFGYFLFHLKTKFQNRCDKPKTVNNTFMNFVCVVLLHFDVYCRRTNTLSDGLIHVYLQIVQGNAQNKKLRHKTKYCNQARYVYCR